MRGSHTRLDVLHRSHAQLAEFVPGTGQGTPSCTEAVVRVVAAVILLQGVATLVLLHVRGCSDERCVVPGCRARKEQLLVDQWRSALEG